MSKLKDVITSNNLYLWSCMFIFIFVNQNLGIFVLLMGMYFGRKI